MKNRLPVRRKTIHFLINLLAALIMIVSFQNCSEQGFQANSSLGTIDLLSTTPDLPDVELGMKLYTQNCAACHGAIFNSTKRNRNATQIAIAINSFSEMAALKSLSQPSLRNIAAALGDSSLALNCNPNSPGFASIHRLNNAQYDNVIRDITGLDLKPSKNFPLDPFTATFNNIADSLGVDFSLAELYIKASIDILDETFAKNKSRIVMCNPTTLGVSTCARQVITEFGLKAFRRPLTETEISQFLQLFEQSRNLVPSVAGINAFDEGLKAPLQAMLVSPNFIYQIISAPVANDSGVKTLSDYELASRLSFMLWGSIPDKVLFDLAAAKNLATPSVLSTQVDRMLKDSKANYLVDSFAMQWLKLNNINNSTPDPTVYPSFSEPLRQSMLTESKMLLKDMLLNDGSPYLALNANYTYMDQRLATHYGVTNSNIPSTGFIKVPLSGTNRSGLITHSSLLMINARPTESSIVQRGLFFLDRILCTTIGSPPPEVDTMNIDTLIDNPRLSLQAHTRSSACAACHNMIDPPGFSLENFDGIGRWRSHYPNGDRVDATGTFSDGKNFNDASEMLNIIAKGKEYRTCVSRKFVTFALGRVLSPDDQCTADTLGMVHVTPESKFSDLIKGIVLSDKFLKQKGEL